MRQVVVLCCRWYLPEALAGQQGIVVDYEPLRLAFTLDEQACDRLGLPHSVDCEGADALMGARMAQLHRIQSDIENTFDLDLGHSGFDRDQLIVDVFTTHQLPGPQEAMALAVTFREAMVQLAGGMDAAIGQPKLVSEQLLKPPCVELYSYAQSAETFSPADYRFRPDPDC